MSKISLLILTIFMLALVIPGSAMYYYDSVRINPIGSSPLTENLPLGTQALANLSTWTRYWETNDYYYIVCNMSVSSGTITPWADTVLGQTGQHQTTVSYTFPTGCTDGKYNGFVSHDNSWLIIASWMDVNSPSSLPVANFTGEPLSGKAPLVVNLTDTSTCSPACTHRTWDFGNGVTQNTTSTTTQVTYLNTGSYDISMTAYNSVGNSSITKSAYVTVTNVPFANFDWEIENRTLFGCNRVVVWDTSQNSPTASWFAMGDYNTCTDPNSTSCGVMRGSILGGSIGDAWIESFNYTYPGSYTVNHNVTNEWGVGYTSKIITIPNDCLVTPTPTPTVNATITPIQTYPVPTLVNGTITSFNLSEVSVLPSSLSFERSYNLSYIRGYILQNNPMAAIFINFIDDFFNSVNNYIMFPVYMALSPILQIVQIITYTLTAFNDMFSGYTTLLSMPYSVIVYIIEAIHWKVKAAITFGLLCDVIIQVWNIKKGDWR